MPTEYLALARVSSREQEREGFSLEVQEEALRRYAAQHGGKIRKLFRIAETATKSEERRSFQELLKYARKNSRHLKGLLFFKVDRAARNLFDYVELERLEQDHGLAVIYVTQPTENTPAGRMMRRTLANMASFYTEQQSVDVREGLARRMESGLFAGKAPYGYRNVRKEGRSLVEVHPEHGPKIRRIFELYAYQNQTIDSLSARLEEEGIVYSDTQPRFTRSKLHTLLRHRVYLGEIHHEGEWRIGQHPPLIDLATWQRVQVLLGEKLYHAHEMLYARELITCSLCGHPITGERKLKRTKRGVHEYVYYRCARYNKADHPRVRLREEELDRQVLALFERIRIEEEEVRAWFRSVLIARTQQQRQETDQQSTELKRQVALLTQQEDRLLNMRLQGEIDQERYGQKSQELRDRTSLLKDQLQSAGDSQDQLGDLALKVFELSQTLKEKWDTANQAQKRQLLETVCLNFSLDDVNLVPQIRRPFDVLAEGPLVLLSRGDRTAIELIPPPLRTWSRPLLAAARVLAESVRSEAFSS